MQHQHGHDHAHPGQFYRVPALGSSSCQLSTKKTKYIHYVVDAATSYQSSLTFVPPSSRFALGAHDYFSLEELLWVMIHLKTTTI
jgi:hypothetical protein